MEEAITISCLYSCAFRNLPKPGKRYMQPSHRAARGEASGSPSKVLERRTHYRISDLFSNNAARIIRFISPRRRRGAFASRMGGLPLRNRRPRRRLHCHTVLSALPGRSLPEHGYLQFSPFQREES